MSKLTRTHFCVLAMGCVLISPCAAEDSSSGDDWWTDPTLYNLKEETVSITFFNMKCKSVEGWKNVQCKVQPSDSFGFYGIFLKIQRNDDPPFQVEADVQSIKNMTYGFSIECSPVEEDIKKSAMPEVLLDNLNELQNIHVVIDWVVEGDEKQKKKLREQSPIYKYIIDAKMRLERPGIDYEPQKQNLPAVSHLAPIPEQQPVDDQTTDAPQKAIQLANKLGNLEDGYTNNYIIQGHYEEYADGCIKMNKDAYTKELLSIQDDPESSDYRTKKIFFELLYRQDADAKRGKSICEGFMAVTTDNIVDSSSIKKITIKSLNVFDEDLSKVPQQFLKRIVVDFVCKLTHNRRSISSKNRKHHRERLVSANYQPQMDKFSVDFVEKRMSCIAYLKDQNVDMSRTINIVFDRQRSSVRRSRSGSSADNCSSAMRYADKMKEIVDFITQTHVNRTVNLLKKSFDMNE